MTGIYKITGPDGGYIGQSRKIKKRWACLKARKRPNEKLYQSFVKNGIASHTFEVIHELPNDVESQILDNYEKLYIAQYLHCGITLFNRQLGGIRTGCSPTTETRQRISRTMIGRKYSPERIAKTRAARKYSPEMRMKISESLKRYNANK